MKQVNELLKVKKKVYELEVCKSEIGCQIWNYFENTFYTVNEEQSFVLRGTMGEEWLVDEQVLTKTYCQLDGSEIEVEKLTHFFSRIKTKTSQ